MSNHQRFMDAMQKLIKVTPEEQKKRLEATKSKRPKKLTKADSKAVSKGLDRP